MNNSSHTKNVVYVFDLDGVITNPEDSSVNEAVVSKMLQMLSDGIYVVVNTGRSYNWVESNLVSRFLKSGNPSIFTRFISVCEKGGETVHWVNNNAIVSPSEFALNHDDYHIAKKLYENNKEEFNTMFWDDTKRTMATIEKKPSANLLLFHQQQQKFSELLKEAFINKAAFSW
jgi:hydroxymethylpyrimidine pyrophosphatase-like HAD family hydrolase